MSSEPTADPDRIYLAVIETCFRKLSEIQVSAETLEVRPRSAFDKAHIDLPEYPAAHVISPLISGALDHMLMLKRTAGLPPEGSRVWFAQAPWTLLRASLEMGSQALWMLAASNSEARFHRLLQFVGMDLQENNRAVLAHVPTRHRPIPEIEQSVRALELVAGRFGLQYKQLTFRLLDCIKEAARVTKVESPEEAEAIWRMASGLAHGRRWAWETASQFLPAGEVSSGARIMSGSVDFRRIGRTTILVTSTIQMADWYFARRAGHKRPIPEEDQAFFRSGYLTDGWPSILGSPPFPVASPSGNGPTGSTPMS